MADIRKFNIKFTKHNRAHRLNPFNKLLHRHLSLKARQDHFLHVMLGDSLPPDQVYLSPIQDQGMAETCSRFESCASRAAIPANSGKIYDTDAYGVAEGQYLGIQDPQGVDYSTALHVGIDPGFTIKGQSQPSENYAAVIYIYPSNGNDLYDSIQAAIQMYKRPADCAVTWCASWESGVNGLVPNISTDELGGHMTMLNGKVVSGYNNIDFSDESRMVNQNSWGQGAPGSNGGLYLFPRDIINNLFLAAIRIDSDSTYVKLLGKLSALYVRLIDKLSQ